MLKIIFQFLLKNEILDGKSFHAYCGIKTWKLHSCEDWRLLTPKGNKWLYSHVSVLDMYPDFCLQIFDELFPFWFLALFRFPLVNLCRKEPVKDVLIFYLYYNSGIWEKASLS